MAVLALDTSAAVAVALTDGSGRTLAARSVQEHRRHAELLAPLIDEVLTEAGVDRTAVTAVVAGTGPAPFTGLRVGLVTARALALALGVPVHGVCSLDAIAAQAVRDLALAVGTDVLVVTDARRREVYWARYRVTGAATDPERAIELVAGPGVDHPAAVAADGVAGVVVVGRGATLYPDDLPLTAGAPLDPDPTELARLALRRLASDPGAALSTEPLYLRRPDVVPPTARKRVLG
ncbi:tRNA (adenosine(37)-N6)-threonylcarbamoyltransferase complex dimerization subunit type 1 TsaB [Cellulomonas sp. WB94]|uniref:tRNA (adenosine(37)-N6)-threonylcarbamoyltransferase complex dimerization subunit type 1 TsaB n=1 Tax=Cellulomonas sp. WB94 TaxID=2173174 RepID=UPI000D5832F0|nr:tRNA (adenosine(37)-N6)-threonylcarbamoyltransferase complex dimerization subunit type 1 TsaB [Cellulomonas sp. WB94]PVU82369.1 tRNA (adenosine(37)-N6)-threonylcarbamoyltransferase complex dimerization subunit type 1 TsaB [Cellulomonas sp. WB94]